MGDDAAFHRAAVMFLVLAALGVALPTTAAQDTTVSYVNSRIDPLDERWLWGNLTWQAGKGTIVWGAPETSEDLGGAVWAAADGPRGPDEFVSAPTPRPLYLNASRQVQLELLVKTTNPSQTESGVCQDPGFNVVLLAGETHMAGAFRTFNIKHPEVPPDPPTGFLRCPFRMPTEVSYLPAGSVLRLRIEYVNSKADQRYGTSEAAPSQLRLPFFLPEEAFYRMPEIIPRSGTSPAAGGALGLNDVVQDPGASIVGPAAAAGLGLLSFAPRRRPGARRAWGAVLAALVLAAGCIGRPAPEAGPAAGTTGAAKDPGDAVVTHEDPGDTGLANDTSASIVGQVQNSYGLPVPGVFVILVGTQRTTTTDAYGIFSFKELRPGTYTLRLDRDGYVAMEVDVPVPAKQVARVSVRLAYEGDSASGVTPHYHDYWGEETSRTLVDAPLMVTCTTPDCYTQRFSIHPTTTPDHNMIRPGTAELEVILSFEPERVGYTRLGLMVQANEDHGANNWTLYFPRGPDKPFHVATTWEMTDVGHQLFSTWAFRLFIIPTDTMPGGSGNAIVDSYLKAPSDVLNADQPLVTRAQLIIHRGTLPLDPPHPDHWRGHHELIIDQGRKWEIGGTFQSPLTAAFGSALGGCYRPGSEYGYIYAHLDSPSAPIPVETREIVLTAKMNRRTGISGNGEWGWGLWYKDGATPPLRYNGAAPTHVQAPDGTRSADGLTWTWRFPVTEKEADGIYNKKSSWSFTLVPDDSLAACNDAMAHSGTGDYLRMEWSLVAHKPASG